MMTDDEILAATDPKNVIQGTDTKNCLIDNVFIAWNYQKSPPSNILYGTPRLLLVSGEIILAEADIIYT